MKTELKYFCFSNEHFFSLFLLLAFCCRLLFLAEVWGWLFACKSTTKFNCVFIFEQGVRVCCMVIPSGKVGGSDCHPY